MYDNHIKIFFDMIVLKSVFKRSWYFIYIRWF